MRTIRKFAVVECSGSPFEIGKTIGAACQSNIKQTLKMLFGGIGMLNGARPAMIIKNAQKYLAGSRECNPELIEILQGQAEGAGISFDEALTLKCGFDLGGYYGQLSGLCTSFAASGAATAGGMALLGQTIDWFPGCPMDLLKITHEDGQEQLSLVLWGVIEYTLNSDGIGMCANGTWGKVDKYEPYIPIGVYMPQVMRQRNLERAVDVLQKHARGLGYFHLVSASGEMAGVESMPEDQEMMLPDREILVHANHYLTERFQKHDMARVVVPDSFARAQRIRKLMLGMHGGITPALMMDLFTDHDCHPASICRHVDPGQPPQMASATLAAYVMSPAEGRMWIAKGNPCENQYVEYKL